MFVDQLTEELALICRFYEQKGDGECQRAYARVLLRSLQSQLERDASTDLDTHCALLHGGRKLDIVPSNA